MSNNIFLDKAKNDSHTLYYLENDVKKYIHSKYNPQKEAENIIKNVDLDKYDFIVVFGNGLGYVLDQLLKIKNIKKIIIVEAEKTLYEYFQKVKIYDIPGHVDFIICNDCGSAVNIITESFDLLNYKGFHLLEIPSLITMYSKYFNKLREMLNPLLQKKINNQLTESALGVALLNNFFHAVTYSNEIRLIKINKEITCDKKAVIISAGISLSKDIEALKKIQDNVYIFCVDTAFKYLIKRSITPDFVFSMDPQFYSYLHYNNEDIKSLKSVFVCDLFSGFSLEKIINNASYLISKNFISNSLFDQEDLLDSSGGSITNYIYQFIKNDFQEIVFIGLDLGYADLNMYIPHSYINEYFLKRNSYFNTIQDQYTSFYIKRAKRKIKFANNEYNTTSSMISYYIWLNQNIKNNVSLSDNSFVEFDNIKKISINKIDGVKKDKNFYNYKNINNESITKRLNVLSSDNMFVNQLINLVISSKYLNEWKKFDNIKKEKIYDIYKHKLIEKIENLN